ncbi:MAG TPA: NAD(P)/FAD-dependent oxidoreductase [Chitinophagaceae bacterium]
MEKFDVIVIGTGSGSSVAQRCAIAGKKTAIIDYLPYGGTCALRGCDPKKVLVGLAHVLSLNKQLQGKGLGTPVTASWKDLMEFKKSFTEPVPGKREKALKSAGVTTYHGRAHFISENTLQINEDILQAKKFVIANGAKPRKLSIPGEELLIDSTAFLELQELPKEILFVGGGYIAFEFAHIVSSFGAKATIVHRGERPLENFDSELVKLLMKASEAAGIKIILKTNVTGISKENGHLLIQAEQEGKGISFSTLLAVHSAGRTADIDDLRLEKVNVSVGKKGVEVNEYMQSVSNPDIYACGDANDKGIPLTPVGRKEAIVLSSNLLKGNHLKIDYGYIPSNVFSLPTLASVGLTEDAAKIQKLNYRVNYEETTGWYASKRLNEPVTAFKVLIDKETGLILGAHLLGNNAEETINIFAVAMNAGLKASELKKTIFSYPTNASDIVYML